MRIAILGLHTECASTSPLPQMRSDFTRSTGAELIAMAGVDFAAHGIEAVPLLHERAVPGGPVLLDLYRAQCDDILQALRDALPLDGVLLLMHGAYFVPSIDDPEGDFIAAIRDLVGPDAILSAAFDLHGQITAQIADTLDAFAAYRTAPHIDVAETRARAAKMLIRALGGPRPQVVRVPVPVLVSGEMSSTEVQPCNALYAALPDHHSDTVWDANLMAGYVWADTPRATACAVVTCTDTQAGTIAARAIAQSYWDARHELVYGMPSYAPATALTRALGALPATLADSGDNPTAGGVGDRADMLALLPDDLPPTLIAGIWAPEACAALDRGARQITLGDGIGGGPTVTLAPEEMCPTEGDWVVRRGALTIALTRKRRPFHTEADFARLGLRVADHALLIVKSGYLSPYLAAQPRAAIMALSDGAVTQDFAAIPNAHRPHPTFPFQNDFAWSAS